MKIIATDNFQPTGVTHVVRAGEILNAPAALATRLMKQGLAVAAKRAPELAMRAATERAVPFRNLRPENR